MYTSIHKPFASSSSFSVFCEIDNVSLSPIFSLAALEALVSIG